MTGIAELGVIASVIQIADVGLKLSTKLYDFAGKVASADKAIASISRDVKLTSTVLKDLGETLERDKESRIVSDNAVQTAGGIVKECLEVFQEMDKIFLKRTPLLRQVDEADKATRGRKMMERLWWPYIQSRVLLLRSNLERLKSTLLLMLNVITYAKWRTASSEPPSVIASQRELIKKLDRSNQKYVRKFEKIRNGTQKKVLDIETDAQSDDSKNEEEVSDMETDTCSHSSINQREASDIETDMETDAQSPSAASEKGASDEGMGSQASSPKAETKDLQLASLDAETYKVDTLGLNSAADNLCTGKRESLKTPLGEIPKENIESDGQKPSEPPTLQPGIVAQTSMHALSIYSNKPAKPKSEDRVSGESSKQLPHFEASRNVKLEGDTLLEHLKHYIVLINDLIGYIDIAPEVLPLSSRQTVRDMLNHAYNVEIEQLAVQYGQPAVLSAAQEIGPPFSGGFERSSIDNRTTYDRAISTPSLPFYPGLSAESIERNGEKLSSVGSEAGKDLPRSLAPSAASETIRVEAAMNDQNREEPIIHRTSNASTVHDLLRSGWKFQARTKSSVRLLKRLEGIGSGIRIYAKPITHNRDVQTLHSDHPTHYSIGINLPNIKEIFSPSFQSLAISSPKNPVRLSDASADNRASTHPLPAAAASAATPTSPPRDPCKTIKFNDCIGRRFSFPFHLCKEWLAMEYLIKEAFLHVEEIGPKVAEGFYDLLGPDNEIILESVWEAMIQPGWEIKMELWPMSEPPPEEVLSDIVADTVIVPAGTPPPASTMLDPFTSTGDEKKSAAKKKNIPPFMAWTAGSKKRGRKRQTNMAKRSNDDLNWHVSDSNMKDESRGDSASIAEFDVLGFEEGSLKRDDGEYEDRGEKKKKRHQKYKEVYSDEGDEYDEVDDLLALWTTVPSRIFELEDD